MKTRWFMLLLISAIGGLTACNRQPTSSLPPLPNPPQSTADASAPSPTPASQLRSKTGSNGASTSGIAPLPVPELIPPTVSVQRLPQIETGRADPFAAFPVTPTVVAQTPPSPTPTAASPTTTVVPLPPVTITAPLPVVQPAVPGVLPPPPRPVSPTQLAEAIEISGVMQVGGKTNIIVKVPEEGTSRSVQVGDSMANGQVRVKRVEMGADPIVVLEQNGREITRSVGSSVLTGLL